MKKIDLNNLNNDTALTIQQLREAFKIPMIYTIVSVKDRALNAYGRPIFVHTQGQAIRSFQDEINRSAPDNEMYKHPEDYDLYFLCTFNDATGEFSPHGPETIKLIAIGKQMKLQKE